MFPYPKTSRLKKLFYDFGKPEVKVDWDCTDWDQEYYKVFCLHETETNPLTGKMEAITPWFRSREELEEFLNIHMTHYEVILFDLYFEGGYKKDFRWFWL